MSNYDSLIELEKQRKKELKSIEKVKKQDFILETVRDELLGVLIEHYGVDVVLDHIGFETCKEYFKIELEEE